MNQVTKITTCRDETGAVVKCVGEMDLANADELNKALEGASGSRLTVDLRSADYIDSAIIQAVMRAGLELLRRNDRLRVLVASGSHPDYVLRELGFESVLDIECCAESEGRDE